MKKLFFIFSLLFLSNFSNAQKELQQVANYYFRLNPFNEKISSFLRQLMNDSEIMNPVVIKRTDTSLFYFKGDYKNFNPFFFKPVRTMVVFAEKEIILNDSLHLLDTVITYQIAGYSPDGEEGVKDVMQEFKRFDRKYLKKFKSSDFTELKSNGEVYGGIRNYFTGLSYLSPLSAAWQKIGDNRGNVFVITLRFKMSENDAILPVTPYGF